MSMSSQLEQVDMQIVEASSTASAADFESEVSPHLRALRQTAVRLSRNSMDAEDLVQNTLVCAFRFWDQYVPGTNCRAWLFQILRNQYINDYRSNSRRPSTVNIDSLEESYLPRQTVAADSDRTPEQVVINELVDDDLLDAIRHIRDEYRQVVVLYYLHGHTYKQIAQSERLNMGTVKSRLYRGRKMLRAKLRKNA